jgi:hypothetical protein
MGRRGADAERVQRSHTAKLDLNISAQPRIEPRLRLALNLFDRIKTLHWQERFAALRSAKEVQRVFPLALQNAFRLVDSPYRSEIF